jgi:hypothetical protein
VSSVSLLRLLIYSSLTAHAYSRLRGDGLHSRVLRYVACLVFRCKKPYNEELRSVYSLQNIIWKMESKRMGWTRRVESTG